MDHRTDKVWVLGIQSKLYQWSKANPDDQWRDMWGWLTDLRVLRHAWHRVASNKGGRTAGVDGMTVGRIRNKSEDRFLVELQADLRSGAYRPSPARRKFIPKAGKPGQFRPLGIPTIRDRVVKGAVKDSSGANLRGAILACLLRVPTWQEHPWRLGVYSSGSLAAEAGQGHPAKPVAIPLGY
jgi:retron-type reverse transcriptase